MIGIDLLVPRQSNFKASAALSTLTLLNLFSIEASVHSCYQYTLLDTNCLHHYVQDGSIQYEVKLTGCLSTSVLSEGEGMDPTHGTLIAPHLNAQIHQNYFCVRLDMAVDDADGGAALTVTEVT